MKGPLYKHILGNGTLTCCPVQDQLRSSVSADHGT